MDFRVKKGTKISEVYYTFLFMENEDEFDYMIKFYEQNLWWFSKFPPDAKKQCEIKYNSARDKCEIKKINEKANEVFKKYYE